MTLVSFKKERKVPLRHRQYDSDSSHFDENDPYCKGVGYFQGDQRQPGGFDDVRQSIQGQHRGSHEDRRSLQGQQFQSGVASSNDLFNFRASQPMPEIRKNKSQDSSEHQQSVNLVKKCTNMDIKVKDNIFSAQSGSDVGNTLVLSEASKLSTDKSKSICKNS